MLKLNKYLEKTVQIQVALTIMFVPLLILVNQKIVSAAELSNRSIIVGTSEASAITHHVYNFNINTSIMVGSLEMEYCTNSPFVGDACTAPAGFSLVAATIGAQSGLTGFTIHPNSTINKLVLGRVPAGVVPPVATSIRVNNVQNPNNNNESVFVRISTYATNDGTGIRGDKGTVVFSTSRQINVNGFVPPYLTFCVANIVSSDCTVTIGNYLDFGELSTSQTKTATSQFAVATNDVSGYVTTINGVTLTSGNNEIPSLTLPSISSAGNSQFGINLRSNSSPLVGSDVVGFGTGSPAPNYNIPNNYYFSPGLVASSPFSTDFNIYTVTYIANISSGQPPGVYISTLTYFTTVSF